MGITYRSRREQQMDMLLLLKEEDRIQTALMYGCNLDHRRVTSYLQELVEKSLVAWNERTGRYCLTIAGKDCLGRYAAWRELI